MFVHLFLTENDRSGTLSDGAIGLLNFAHKRAVAALFLRDWVACQLLTAQTVQGSNDLVAAVAPDPPATLRGVSGMLPPSRCPHLRQAESRPYGHLARLRLSCRQQLRRYRPVGGLLEAGPVITRPRLLVQCTAKPYCLRDGRDSIGRIGIPGKCRAAQSSLVVHACPTDGCRQAAPVRLSPHELVVWHRQPFAMQQQWPLLMIKPDINRRPPCMNPRRRVSAAHSSTNRFWSRYRSEYS